MQTVRHVSFILSCKEIYSQVKMELAVRQVQDEHNVSFDNLSPLMEIRNVGLLARVAVSETLVEDSFVVISAP